MGVQGLTPFLQKICPALLKKLPNRLQDIQGKRIVIDGTLITQRLHFSQGQGGMCQHVWGWYRIAKDLHDNGITAICVFDGETRSLAKAREVKRRHDLRRLAATRGSIENDRLQRLSKLKRVTEHFQGFRMHEKRTIAERLCKVTFSQEGGASALLQQQILPLAGDQNSIPPSLLQEKWEPIPLPVYPFPSSPNVRSRTVDRPLTLDQTLRTFESLSLEYKANVAKLASVAPPEPLLSVTDEEDQAYRGMTKAQNELTADEGKVWGKIATSMSMYTKPSVPTTSLDFGISTVNDIHALADRSFIMTTSLLRRTHIPTNQTYQESKEILKAMGIPCISATDATEAEALASAMVHQGLADFVVTEDTDVLVYEAPMIKNITSRMEPLVIVSGAEVRAELDLDRDAFIDFALLLGTDFSQRISNVGPIRAYKFIKSHGSIERIIELETKYEPRLPREAYLAEVEQGRLVYKTLPKVPSLKLNPTPKNDTEVAKVLKRHGLVMEGELLAGNYFSDDPTAW